MSLAIAPRAVWPRAAVTALFLGNGVMIGTWVAAIPRVKEAQGLSDSALGALLFAVGIGAIAAMALAGPLSARIGAARLAAGAALLVGLLFPVIPLVPTGWPLYLLAALVGAINGTMDVAMNAAASQLERRLGSAIMSSFHAGWSFGALGGSALAGALAGLGVSVPAAFAVGSAGLAFAAACGATLPAIADGAAPARRSFRLPSRRLLAIAVLATLAFSAEGGVADWFGVYLRTVIGTDPAFATTAYTALAVAMVAGRLTGDRVVRRFDHGRVVAGGSALAACGIGLALAWPNRWMVDAGLVVAGAGLANCIPSVFSAAGRVGGVGGLAAVSASGYSALLVAPPVLGAIADMVGLRLALLLLPAVCVAMALLSPAVAARNAAAA